MEIQQKTTTYLHWGSVFAVLNALLFSFMLILRLQASHPIHLAGYCLTIPS